MAAFDGGLALGAEGLELDVHLSRDGVVVVHHDRTLERTTNLTGPIAHRTAGELARADAGYFFRRVRQDASPADSRIRQARCDGSGPAEFPFRGCGITIPTLADVLGRYRDIPIIVELKVNHPELARAVVSVVRAGGRHRSGLPRIVRAAGAARGAASRAGAGDERGARRGPLGALPIVVPLAGRARRATAGIKCRNGRAGRASCRADSSQDAHAAGLGVQVWTVDTEADAGRLLDWGVDALITDRPDIMVPFVRGRMAARD